MKNQVHVIAEAGTNHNADIETAFSLIKTAKNANANSVKFQLIYPEGLYLPKFYKNGNYEDNEVFDVRRKGMLSDDAWRDIAAYCKKIDFPLSWSVFDLKGLILLDEFEIPYIKIASCDLNNGPLLKEAADRGKTLIISTGMASLGEIEKAVSHVTSKHEDIVLMHCVSIYPCPIKNMNLNFIDTLNSAFGFPVGLSDHTESSLAAAIGIAKGVRYIEKHFTLDRTSKGFDHAYAMEPDSLIAYINDIRDCEYALSRPETKISQNEFSVKYRARRGLYAAHSMEPGDVIQPEDILVVRPEGPLCPNDIFNLIGKTLKTAIKKYEPLTTSLFDC